MKNWKKFLIFAALASSLLVGACTESGNEKEKVSLDKKGKLIATENILGVEVEIEGEVTELKISDEYIFVSSFQDGKTVLSIVKKGSKISAGEEIADFGNITGKNIVLRQIIGEGEIEKAALESGKLKRAGEKLLGDFNNDETIDLMDFNLLKQNFGKTGSNVCDIAPAVKGSAAGWESIYAFSTPDSKVDLQDLSVFGNNYGKTVPTALVLQSISVSGSTSVIEGSTINVTVTATDTNGTSKVVTSGVTYTSSNTTVVSIESGIIKANVEGTSTITVSYEGKTATFVVTVKKDEPVGEYYATNPNGQVGKNKTITSLSDWTEDMKIAQGAASDTARSWIGYHEYPDPDLYALFAAWDDKNLYLMVEIPNIDDADTVDNDKSYAGSQFLPMGWGINTGKRTAGTGSMVSGDSVWQGSEVYSYLNEGIDTLIMHHPRLNVGTPGFFITDSSGKFSYEEDYLLSFALAGIVRDVYFNQSVSKNMWTAVTSSGDLGGKTSTDMDSYDYVDLKAEGKKMSAYQITVPLASLGIDKNYLETTGIGVSVFSTYGESMMDTLPWDPAMIDNASTPYSKDPSSSAEKEDFDEVTAPLARVGKK